MRQQIFDGTTIWQRNSTDAAGESWRRHAGPDLAMRRPGAGTSNAPPLLHTRVIHYTYDGLLRLTEATASEGYDYGYSYDDAGNRTGVWLNGTRVLTQTFDAANQVVGWSYDAAGNLLDDGSSTYEYDALNRLVEQDGTANSYNGDGVLVERGTTTYTQDLASPLSQVLADSDATYIYGLDRLVSETGGTRSWYAADGLGSVRRTLDDDGQATAALLYDPWGQVESGATPGFGFTGEIAGRKRDGLPARPVVQSCQRHFYST